MLYFDTPSCLWVFLTQGVALRAYSELLTAEPRRGSTLVLFSSVTVSGLRTSDYTVLLTSEPFRGSTLVLSSLVTILRWRTTCLYGVSYSRASPRLPDDVVFACFLFIYHYFLL